MKSGLLVLLLVAATVSSQLIGGGDHDKVPHGNSGLIGGDDHDYRPHVKPIGGDDHDYRPHGNSGILGGDDHDYRPHAGQEETTKTATPLIGGDDTDRIAAQLAQLLPKLQSKSVEELRQICLKL